MSDPEPGLRGVIAAAATPITPDGEPDIPRFLALCRWLLANGCDGLNICGTTGEATSFTTAQRMAVMRAAAAELPTARLMAGTGAASVGDAVALTRHAAELGLAAALLLPPFYYKSVDDDGIAGYFRQIVEATAARPVALYLYNFPALSGVEYTPLLVRRLRGDFPGRIHGLKEFLGQPRLRIRDRRAVAGPSRLPQQRGDPVARTGRRVRRLHFGQRERQRTVLRARLPERRWGRAGAGDAHPRAPLAQGADPECEGGPCPAFRRSGLRGGAAAAVAPSG